MKKGKLSQIRYNANKSLRNRNMDYNSFFKQDHIDKMLAEEREKQRPAIIKRKNS
jgi:hypothetical protein